MFLDSIISGKRNFIWILFHIILGFLCTLSPIVLIVWFYLIFLTNINKAILNLKKGKTFYYIALFTYLTGFEILGRMAKAYPFIPLELSKYFLILFGVIGIVITSKFEGKYIILILLVSIGLFYDYSDKRLFTDIVNCYFGVLALCISISFLSVLKFDNFDINSLLKLLLFSILPALSYSYIKTPDFEEIEFKLSANFDTAGGAATNQVSTVFGVGFLICFYLLYTRKDFAKYRFIEFLIGLSFFAQGLLTFSRGGIIVALFAVFLIVYLDISHLKFKNIFLGIIITISLFFMFNLINDITGGKLLLRYQGETEGTYEHGAEKDLKKLTSGRSLIFEEDLKLWFSHPILGVGIGGSRFIRGVTEEEVSSHIELSRLLAEQGILGLVYFIVLLSLGYQLWIFAKFDRENIIYFIIFFIGMSTTFHAAMRTFVTPLLISLSVIGTKIVKKRKSDIFYRSN
jgi:hypothetical protein